MFCSMYTHNSLLNTHKPSIATLAVNVFLEHYSHYIIIIIIIFSPSPLPPHTHLYVLDESDACSGNGGAFEGDSSHLVGMMQEKLKELSAIHSLVIEHNAELVKLITEIENRMEVGSLDLISKLKERLALFKLASESMAKVQTKLL